MKKNPVFFLLLLVASSSMSQNTDRDEINFKESLAEDYMNLTMMSLPVHKDAVKDLLIKFNTDKPHLL
ncbi:MAG: hypothetical protein ABIO46_02940 [Chitinophagales bacterium]